MYIITLEAFFFREKTLENWSVSRLYLKSSTLSWFSVTR